MTDEVKVSTAHFADIDDNSSHKVIVYDSAVGMSFVVDIGPDSPPLRSPMFAPTDFLKVAESLDCLATAYGSRVPGRLSPFVRYWDKMAEDVHQNAKDKGFWPVDAERNDGEMIALMHAELSELLEALREKNPPDNKLPQFSAAEVELADVVIRLMDYARARNFRVAEAIEAKAAYNKTRPHKHGKEF